MNTKKARGKRSPLGRCLKSTKLWPDVQRTERTWTTVTEDEDYGTRGQRKTEYFPPRECKG